MVSKITQYLKKIAGNHGRILISNISNEKTQAISIVI